MNENTEIRTFQGTCEIRAGAEGEPTVLVGIAPPWNTLSSEGALPGFREVFKRGAFSNLKDGEIVATLEHDNSKPLGRSSAGTLTLKDTPEGLRYEVELDPGRSHDADLMRSVERGDITGSSFEFFVSEDGDKWVEEAGAVTRTIKRGGGVLRQVGPVLSPAFRDAPAVSLRCEQKLAEIREADEEATEQAERDSANRRRELDLAEAEALL